MHVVYMINTIKVVLNMQLTDAFR